jgi:glycosyltransferase involved in cell wall biosynthesis
LKVLILLSRLHRGGAEIRTLNLLKFIKLNYSVEVTIFLTSGDTGVLDDEFRKLAEIVYRDKKTSILQSYYYVLKQVQPTVIHINANLASGVYCFVAKILQVPVRISHIRTAADYGHGAIYKAKKVLFNMLTNAFSTKVIGVCDGARTLTNTPLNKWETVYNGIDTSTVLDSPKHTLKGEHKRIIMLGRIDPVKNHKFIINVFSSFSKDDNITLDIFGEGESAYVDSLKALIEKQNLIDIVNLKGETSNPLETINNYDLMVLPSLREGLPGVVLESLSCGVPVISAKLLGALEIAKYSSHVKCLTTSKGSELEWKNEINAFHVEDDRMGIKSELEQSPFIYEKHCKIIYSIWSGS